MVEGGGKGGETARGVAVKGADVDHECLCRGVTSRTATTCTTSRVTTNWVGRALLNSLLEYRFTNSGYSALRLMYTSNHGPHETPRLSKTHSHSPRRTRPRHPPRS